MGNNREKGQLSKLGDASRLALSPSGRSANCEPERAAARATLLFGYYPRNEANDPEIFITGATAMLASYPEIVVERVCDPIRGLPAKSKFLPSIAEIRSSCELEMVWHDAVERRDRDRAHTRKVLEPILPPPAPMDRMRVRQMADELLAELKTSDPRKIDFRPPRSPGEAEAARRHFEARLPELQAEYSARPPVIGLSLRQANRSVEAYGVDSGATESDDSIG
jgi:hypothetical protein